MVGYQEKLLRTKGTGQYGCLFADPAGHNTLSDSLSHLILRAALRGVQDRYLQAISHKGKLIRRSSTFYFNTGQNQDQDLGLLIPSRSDSFNTYFLRPDLGPGLF